MFPGGMGNMQAMMKKVQKMQNFLQKMLAIVREKW